MIMTANNSTVSVSLGENGSSEKRATPKPVGKTKCSESRKIRKPLMEKKRRARINESLNELKRILLEANGTPSRKEGNRPAKLEKADILELTVRHLQTLQNSKSSPMVSPTSRVPVTSSTTSISDIEVDEDSSSSSTSSSILDTKSVRNKTKAKNFITANSAMESQSQVISDEQMACMLDRNARSVDLIKNEGNNTYLIPTRLPNGDVAFVLKRSSGNCNNQTQQSHSFANVGISIGEIKSEVESYADSNFKSYSQLSDNHNRVYHHLDETIIPIPSSNNDKNDNFLRLIWRPW